VRLVRDGGLSIAGIVIGSHDVTTTEEFATTDPDTGERTPEVVRIASFAIAHDTATLRAVTTGSTDGRPLGEFLRL
jgi:hypothetical protein